MRWYRIFPTSVLVSFVIALAFSRSVRCCRTWSEKTWGDPADFKLNIHAGDIHHQLSNELIVWRRRGLWLRKRVVVWRVLSKTRSISFERPRVVGQSVTHTAESPSIVALLNKEGRNIEQANIIFFKNPGDYDTIGQTLRVTRRVGHMIENIWRRFESFLGEKTIGEEDVSNR